MASMTIRTLEVTRASTNVRWRVPLATPQICICYRCLQSIMCKLDSPRISEYAAQVCDTVTLLLLLELAAQLPACVGRHAGRHGEGMRERRHAMPRHHASAVYVDANYIPFRHKPCGSESVV
eukprot:1901510-Pleurochrysis_carterae.AAC.3